MRNYLLVLSLLAVSGATAACSQKVGDDAASADSNLGSDQAGIDVQTLQIWTPGKAFPLAPQPWQSSNAATDVTIHADDPNACPVTNTVTEGSYSTTTVDCTAAFAKVTPFDVTGASGPVATPVQFTIEKQIQNGAQYVDPDFCNRVEMRIVVRDEAAAQPTFAGIGFFTSKGDSFTAKSDLQSVGHVRLKNGDAATVYRFTGISTCISSAHNSTSGNEFQTFSFKPYAAYDTPSDNGGDPYRYRVWENISGNQTIGHSWPGSTPSVNRDAFDRQSELLSSSP